MSVDSAAAGKACSCIKVKMNLLKDASARGGYRDVNLLVGVTLPASGATHVCELQLNLTSLLKIKARTGHSTYAAARQLRAFEPVNFQHVGPRGS